MSRLNETAAALSIISLLISLMFFVTHNMTDAIYVLGIAILAKPTIIKDREGNAWKR